MLFDVVSPCVSLSVSVSVNTDDTVLPARELRCSTSSLRVLVCLLMPLRTQMIQYYLLVSYVVRRRLSVC